MADPAIPSGWSSAAPPPIPQGWSETAAPPIPQGWTDNANPSTDWRLGQARGILASGQAAKNAYMNADLSGFGGFVARKMIDMGLPVINGKSLDQTLREKFPGQTDDWYASAHKNFVNQGVIQARQQTAEGAKGGSPVANFAAGVLGAADPSWLVPVGKVVGMAKGVVPRAAIGAASMAGLSAADDAAYQLTDMADGIQKNFDVNRSLQSAEFGGAFGGASEFVHGLFADRGRDTTPAGDPRTQGPQQFGLSMADKAQYADVLKTGNADQINGFFAGRRGPRPDPQQVDRWVTYRDGVPEGYADEAYQPQFNYEAEADRQRVQDRVDQLTQDWTNKPEINVVHSIDADLHPELRDPNALGLKHADGSVSIVSDRVNTPEKISAVLYHEALGHYGLAQKFGDQLDTVINSLDRNNVGQFSKDVDKWQKQNPKLYGGDRTRAAEEVLAEMSQKGPIKNSIMDALTAHVRRFGRKLGLKLNYSDAEVRTILGMAHDAVINGQPSAAANRFRGGDRYMYGGRKAADAQYRDYFKAPDNTDRTEINDSRSKLVGDIPRWWEGLDNPGQSPKITYLSDVLHHPELYEAYPHLQDIEVEERPMDEGTQASYNPHQNTIAVRPGLTRSEFHSALLHETQHAIQDYEGHAVGAGDDLSDEDYHRTFGEVEARDTQNRRYLGAGDRSVIPPYSSEPLPPKGYRFDYGDEAKAADRQMRASQLGPEDMLQETFDSLDRGYVPRFRTWEQAQDAARDSALDPAELKKTRGVGYLDKKLYQYDNAAQQLQEQLRPYADKVDAGEPLTDEESIRVMEIKNQFHYALGKLDNDLGEVARALNAAKQLNFSRNNILRLKDALGDDPLAGMTDPENMHMFLKQFNKFLKAGNPKAANLLAKGTSKPNWEDYLLSFRQEMMLSGVSTHVKAPMDMITNAFVDTENKIMALAPGVLRDIAQGLGMNVKTGVKPAEVAAHFWGLLRSSFDAQTWKDTADAFNKGRINNSQNQNMPKLPGILSIPTKLIAAQDTFFRSVVMNAHLRSLGVRDAYAKGLTKWDDVQSHAANTATFPTTDQIKQAENETARTVLMNKNVLNDALNAGIGKLQNSGPVGRAIAFPIKMLTAFSRIGLNAFSNQIIRRSPLAYFDPYTIGELKAGGARADIANMKILLGSFVMWSAWVNYKKILGDNQNPDSSSKLAAMEAGGYRPNAYHDPGRYDTGIRLNMSINPFDQHNNVSLMVANLHKAMDEGAQPGQLATGAKLALTSLIHEWSNSSFVGNLTPLADAATAREKDMGGKFSQLVSDEAKTFLPNLTNQAAKIIDPNQHDTKGDILGTLQANIPFASKGLPIKYDTQGQPVPTGTTWEGVHVNDFLPGNHINEPTDPAQQEINRLEGMYKETLAGPALRSITIKGDKSMFKPEQINGNRVKLTNAQFEDYQHRVGYNIVEYIRQEMASPQWATMSDEDKAYEIKDIAKDARKSVKEQLYGE